MLLQTGKYYYPEMKCLKEKSWQFVCWSFRRMDGAYAVADLLFRGPGAGTISELCLSKTSCAGTSPNVAEDHQTK